MIFRRWEVQVRDLRIGGCGFVRVSRHLTHRGAVLAAEYRGGRVHDRRHRVDMEWRRIDPVSGENRW